MMLYVYIALAGAAGALARFGVGKWAYTAFEGKLAMSTLIVNVVGSFILAFILAASIAGKELMPIDMKTAVTVGFLGAFTTFSTFSYETLHFVQIGKPGVALGNIGANLFFGLGAGALGILLGRMMGS
ncbi:CrcB family protein [bacterium]|nr:CrcB family protein [bacterium]MCB9480101.1 CrcB family protein [Deltaproteobacteria bacterium]